MVPGDICWVYLTAPAGDTELMTRRPAVVLQAPAVSEKLPTVLVAPLTLEIEALRFPGTVAVEPDRDNGLQQALVALVFQVTAVDAALVAPTNGSLSDRTLAAIWAELDRLTGRGQAREPRARAPRTERGTSPLEEGFAPERSLYEP